MLGDLFRVYFINVRISRLLNEQLNKLCGRPQIARSKVMRLALEDFLRGKTDNRRELDRSIKKYGYAAVAERC